MKYGPKVFFFCCVCYVTSFVTSTILAQQNKKVESPTIRRPQVAVPVDPVTAETPVRLPENAVLPPPIALGKMQCFAESHLRSQEIVIKDGIASVKAHASLGDKRPGMTYFWRLGAADRQGNILAGTIYDHQIFSVEANGQKEVDFADTIEVPQGTFRIELVLYEKPVDRDFSFLKDRVQARASEMIRVVKLLDR